MELGKQDGRCEQTQRCLSGGSRQTPSVKGILGGGNKYYYFHSKCRKSMAVINYRFSLIYTIMN